MLVCLASDADGIAGRPKKILHKLLLRATPGQNPVNGRDVASILILRQVREPNRIPVPLKNLTDGILNLGCSLGFRFGHTVTAYYLIIEPMVRVSEEPFVDRNSFTLAHCAKKPTLVNSESTSIPPCYPNHWSLIQPHNPAL